MPRSLPTHEANVIVTGCLGSGTGPAPLLAPDDEPSSDEPQPTATTAATSRQRAVFTACPNTATISSREFSGAQRKRLRKTSAILVDRPGDVKSPGAPRRTAGRPGA